MIGAIAGDIIGSTIEELELKAFTENKGNREKQIRSLSERLLYLDPAYNLFPEGSRFTDDTTLSVAIADAIVNNKPYAMALRDYGQKYFDTVHGFGPGFRTWLELNKDNEKDFVTSYSCGNGSAMRVCPVGFAFNSIEKVLEEAKKSAMPSHNSPEGIKGAQAVAVAVFLARTGSSKQKIKQYIEKNFEYDLSRKLDDIRPEYYFKMKCQNSVPEAIIAFLESNNFEDSIRKAISIGGDSDTIACITGGMAEAYYKEIPSFMKEKVIAILDKDMINVVESFSSRYMKASSKLTDFDRF